MNKVLKPCPFCGSDAELTNIVAGPRVQCPNCLACGPCAGTANAYTDDDYAACKDKAVEDWNSLSAVTAERDRLLSDNASLRGSCKALGEENKQLKRENKRQGRTIAAMAAKEA